MKYHIRVPATSANLGPGFDCLGLALELYLHVWANPADSWQVELGGEGAESLEASDNNLIVQTYLKTCERNQWEPNAFHLRCENNGPMCRGLGSSSTAIVAGISLAFQHHHRPDRQLIFDFAHEVEGHPDNVGPAIFGGLQFLDLNHPQKGLHALDLHPALRVAVIVPDFHVSTEAMRAGLPALTQEDAVRNQHHLEQLVAGLASLDSAGLACSEKDLRHQPFRLQNQPQTQQIFKTIQLSGLAKGVFLSGSGPSIGLWVEHDFQVEALETVLAPLEIPHRVLFLTPDLEGVFYESCS